MGEEENLPDFVLSGVLTADGEVAVTVDVGTPVVCEVADEIGFDPVAVPVFSVEVHPAKKIQTITITEIRIFNISITFCITQI
ncbi:MAG: hypothetical protein ABFC24_02590 [Methanoregulaceae archaeon]